VKSNQYKMPMAAMQRRMPRMIMVVSSRD
jgi:hypothetical protein